MSTSQLGKTLNDRQLVRVVHSYRGLDYATNLRYLAIDYATIFAVLLLTIAVCHNRVEWGVSWWLIAPIYLAAIVVIGACQHRLAGLGHEGAHYTLLRNRVLNELVSDLFCMFPVFGTTENYRNIHLGHHEYTNDWHRDPELINVGQTRRMNEFPMTAREFLWNFGLRVFWPPTLIRYTWKMTYVNALGHGVHPYETTENAARRRASKLYIRRSTVWGLLYLASMLTILGTLEYTGPAWMIAPAAALVWLAACLCVWWLPGEFLVHTRLRPAYSSKVTCALRMGWLTALEAALAFAGCTTGVHWAVYFWLLWVVPLFTTFPYLMLLRDLVQHANADDGRLTNSRVVFCNPFIRWAMFVYGQDFHLTHHLYPTVPHYRLAQLHDVLRQRNTEYAEHVVECHGFVRHARPPAPTAIDVMHM